MKQNASLITLGCSPALEVEVAVFPQANGVVRLSERA